MRETLRFLRHVGIGTAAVAAYLAALAWVSVLPTLGLAWLFGWLR